MKVVAIRGPEEAAIVARPEPHAGGEFAVIRVCCAPMCTEYKAFRAGDRTDVLGHEAAGEVVEIGRPGRVRVGDRVVAMPQTACGACASCLAGDFIRCGRRPDPLAATGSEAGLGTFGQFLVKQESLLVPIPDGMPYHHAAMACCGLGPTFGAVRRMRVGAPDTVVVTGLGAVGLGAVIHGVARGARVIGVEGAPYRAELARRLGAAEVLDPSEPHVLEHLRDLTGGGADRGIECSGVAAAQRLMIDAMAPRGEVAFIAEAGGFEVRVSADLLRKGLTLHGCWHYNLGDAPAMMAIIGRLGPVLDRFITHAFPMRDVEAAWRLQMAGACGKVVLDPWG